MQRLCHPYGELDVHVRVWKQPLCNAMEWRRILSIFLESATVWESHALSSTFFRFDSDKRWLDT